MTIFARRPALRWLVPVATATVLVTGGAAFNLMSAAARDPLPPRSAAQLLADVQGARVDGLSGTIVENADLGLPELPGVGGSGSSDLASMLAGSHTLRVWYDGPQHVRLSLMGQLGESDVVRNGRDLWTWTSRDRSATHRTLPVGTGSPHEPSLPATPDRAVTPDQLARRALAAIDPSTKVSTDGTAVVAGRSAYELVLQPRDPATLVSSVHIAVDAATHLPTRVRVFAHGLSRPAVEVGFTSFDPTRPDASVFAFNPPPGTRVTQGSGGPSTGGPLAHRPSGKQLTQLQRAASRAPKVVGSGWTTVLVGSVPATGTGSQLGLADQLVRRLPKVSGAWGSGHLLRGTLVSVLLTDDGRLAVGSVAPERLYQALGS